MQDPLDLDRDFEEALDEIDLDQEVTLTEGPISEAPVEIKESELQIEEPQPPTTDKSIPPVEDKNTPIVETPLQQEEPIEKLVAPPSLSAKEKELFEEMPTEAQSFIKEFVLRRDLSLQTHLSKHMNKLNQEYNKTASQYKKLDEVLQPYQDRFRREGRYAPEIVDNLLAWNDFLERDPVSAINQLTTKYLGTQPHPSANMQGYPRQEPYNIPTGDQELEETNQSLLDRIERLEAAKQEAAIQRSTQTVAQFAQMKDTNGNIAFPFVNNVGIQMAEIIPKLQEKHPNASEFEILQAAYEQAAWSNPTIREILLQERQKSSQNLAKVKAEKAAKAKLTAASLPTTISGKEMTQSKNNSLDEDFSEALKEVFV